MSRLKIKHTLNKFVYGILAASLLCTVPISAMAAPKEIPVGEQSEDGYYNAVWENVHMYDTAQHRVLDGATEIGFSEDNSSWMQWYTYNMFLATKKTAYPNLIIYARADYYNPYGKETVEAYGNNDDLVKYGVMKDASVSMTDVYEDKISGSSALYDKYFPDKTSSDLDDIYEQFSKETQMKAEINAAVTKYYLTAREKYPEKDRFDFSEAELGKEITADNSITGIDSKKMAENVMEEQKAVISGSQK